MPGGGCRYNIAQSLLNVVRFNMFDNQRTITAANAPNTVACGVFKRQLDREALLGDPRANDTDEFPGITIELRSKAKATPGLHTNKPSRFIVPGARSIYDLYAAAIEVADVAGSYSLDEEPGAKSTERAAGSTKEPFSIQEVPEEDGATAAGTRKRAKLG